MSRNDRARAAMPLSRSDGPVHCGVQDSARLRRVAPDQLDLRTETRAVTEHIERIDRLASVPGTREVSFGLEVLAERDMAVGARVARESRGEWIEPRFLSTDVRDRFVHLRNPIGPREQHQAHGQELPL